MLSQPSFEFANVAQSVERIHGKDEVCGSIPHVGSKGKHPQVRVFSLTIKNFIVLSCVGS